MVYHLTHPIIRGRAPGWLGGSGFAVLCAGLLCVGLLWASVAHSALDDVAVEQEVQQAQAAVDAFHASLLGVLSLGEHSQRELALLPQITALFDVPRIAAISLGRTWRDLDEVQQSEFVGLLTELIAATYADRFGSASGPQFVVDEVASVKQGFVVRTRLQRPGGDDVTLDYLLQDGRIFNVIADGVSDLSLRRADYNSIVKTEGYAQLLVHMGEKLAQARGLQ